MHFAAVKCARFNPGNAAIRQKENIGHVSYKKMLLALTAGRCTGWCRHRIIDNAFGREQHRGKRELRQRTDE